MNANDALEVQKIIKELSNSMTRADAERDYQKEAIKETAEKYGLEKKHLRKVAKVYHKNTFANEQADHEDFEELYNTMTLKQQGNTGSN